MIGAAQFLLECVLRGFGQMFLANDVGSGLFFLVGLALISPSHAALGLVGAATITLAAWRLGASRARLHTGLFGVNGALLGVSWLLLPELSPWQAVALTVSGALVLAVALVPLTAWFARRRAPLTLFALPCVLVVWISIAVLQAVGVYDCRHLAAWADLAAAKPQDAEREFVAATRGSARSRAYGADGLGWAKFQQADYAAAREQFQLAAEAFPDLADAHDGLGWSQLKLGEFEEAETAFRAAVALDSWSADAWDGLGWTLAEIGDRAEAADCFRRAMFAAPLLADSQRGLAQVSALEEDEPTAAFYRSTAAFCDQWISHRFQYVSTAQLLCWLFFALGVLYHSRISALAAAVVIGLCLLAAHASPLASAALADMNCFYNLLALVLALSGHYLRLRPLAILWTIALGAGMVFVIARWSIPLTACGLPPMSLPCSLGLLLTLIIANGVAHLGGPKLAVPLEIAVTSPKNVRLWEKKCAIAAKCWQRLAKPSSPAT